MFKKITQNLIIFFGVIIFSFALVNSVYASSIPYAFSGDSYDSDIEYGNNANANSNSNSNSVYSRYDYLGQAYPNAYQNNSSASQKETNPTVVNNYYYSTTPKTSTTSNTTVKNNTVAQGDKANVPNANIVARSNGSANYLGASAYDGSNFAASGASKSDGFMPNTIGGWILVIILILAIVVISRIISRKAKENKALAKTA